jgi:hypothetical protein
MVTLNVRNDALPEVANVVVLLAGQEIEPASKFTASNAPEGKGDPLIEVAIDRPTSMKRHDWLFFRIPITTAQTARVVVRYVVNGTEKTEHHGPMSPP